MLSLLPAWGLLRLLLVPYSTISRCVTVCLHDQINWRAVLGLTNDITVFLSYCFLLFIQKASYVEDTVYDYDNFVNISRQVTNRTDISKQVHIWSFKLC